MEMLETGRPAWAWGRRFLPEDRTSRYLVIAVSCSLLVHVLVGMSVLFTGWLSNPVIAYRGELLFVDATPEKPREAASPDTPSRQVGPVPRPIVSPADRSEPPVREARAAAAAPKIAEPPSPRLSEPREAPRAVAPPPAPQGEEPAYEGRSAQAPGPTLAAKAASEAPPQPSSPSLAGDTRVASVPRTFSPSAGALGLPGGGGGGFRGSQGGVVGQAVPLDTPDPNYREYMQRVRQRIYAKWSYPREAQNRELAGRLVIEFHIGKDGQLLSLELVSSSGELVLDSSALDAVKMAERYPPLPEAMQRDVLPVVAIFSYRIRTTQSSTFQLLQ
jgi:TonB family protein